MRLTSTFLSTTAILLATSALALAADLPTAKPAPAPTMAAAPYSWTGFYVGVGGGGAYMQANNKSTAYSSSSGTLSVGHSSSSDLGKFGAFGAIEAGADYQMDRFVVGAFTNFDFKNLRAKDSSLAYVTRTFSGSAQQDVWYKVGNSWDAGLRLGYLVTDRNLLYVLGGYSGAQISSGIRETIIGVGPGPFIFGASESSWKSGYVLGGGLETALTDHISLKAEYRYANYGKASSSYSSSSAYARQSATISVQSVRVGLDYKF